MNTILNEKKEFPMLEAVNLTKKYEDGLLALDNVNFKVHQGEIYAMLGGNGAGKTTTINIFLNLIEPTSGETKINGIVTHQQPLEAKKHVSFVSENVMLYPEFTALQNLDFFTRLGGKTNLTKDDYRQVLLRVGLQEDAHRRAGDIGQADRRSCPGSEDGSAGITLYVDRGGCVLLSDRRQDGFGLRLQRCRFGARLSAIPLWQA